MKQKLEKELLNSIETVKEYLVKGAEFASEQTPLVIEELIRFNLIYSGVWLLFGIFFLVACVPLAKKSIEYIQKDEPVGVIMGVMCGLSPLIGSFIVIENIRTFTMCLTAPRLFVIEYLGKLI